MRKWGAFAIGGVLLISLATPVNAATPKAGATCTKKGATATSAGKLYTCILSGKKLVWNKGVAIKLPSRAATPSSETKPDIKNLLATDSRITPISELTSFQTCKTKDMTPSSLKNGETIYQNGFPRPSVAITGKKIAKILVIPMAFKDLAFNNQKMSIGRSYISDIEAMNKTIPRVIDFYRELSFGKFEISIDVLPESEWWNFNFNHPFINAPQSPNSLVLLDLIKKEKSQYRFSGYDAYVFLAGYGQGYIAGTAAYGEIVPGAVNGSINTALLIGAHNDEATWVHELGHALFALEDLYLFNQSATTLLAGAEIPVSWDLMASNKASLLRWNRLLMGWLPDSAIRCISDQHTSFHYLAKSEIDDYPQLLTINVSTGVTLVAEAKGINSTSSGVLLYLVNTYNQSGQGPVQVQKTLLSKAKTKSWFGWDITVVESNGEGVLIEVNKTDVDKFVVPPERTPPPNNPNPGVTPVVDKNTNIDGQGCQRGEADVTNTFGKFVCTSLPDGNNLWKKQG
jgi:hypothetical protein